MNTKKDRRAQVRFSPAKFRQLPMGDRLAYLRAAFASLNRGKPLVEVTRTGARKPQRSARLPSYIRLLSMAGFERLTPAKKIHYLKYLSRAYAELQMQMTAYLRTSATTASPISSVPTNFAPPLTRSAVRKPRAKTERTAVRMRSSPSKSSKE